MRENFTSKDFMLTGESFKLIYQPEWDMYKTDPQPKLSDLPKYYKSEAYISHTDAKRTWFDKIYQIVKQIALRNKVALIDSFNTSDKQLLDIGCGTGEFLLTAQKNKWQVVGVEPNEQARTLAQEKINANAIYLSLNDLIQNQTKQFDVITLWHVLEHVPDLDIYITKIKSLLKAEGVLVIAVPNYKSYDAAYYKEFWAAFDVPRHLWHFSQKSISLIFSKYKMQLEKTLPMKFDSYYVSLLSEKYKTGKSRPFHAFKIGFLSNFKARRTTEYSSLIYMLKNQ